MSSPWGYTTNVWTEHAGVSLPTLGAGDEPIDTGHTPPVNDNFEDAIVLTGDNLSVSLNNSYATIQAGEDATNFRSAWYSWTPTVSARKIFKASKNSGKLVIYTGNTLTTLTRIISGTKFSLNIVAGTTYRIAACDVSSVSGGYIFTVVDPIPGDFFEDAIPITQNTFSIPINNSLATVEVGEPTVHYHSIWYSFTPLDSGLLNINTSSSQYNMAVYTGDSITNLKLLVTPGQHINVQVLPYVKYYIVVYTTFDSFGSFTFSGSLTVKPVPPNDYFSGNILLSGDAFTVAADNTMATMQLYESATNYFSLWYQYIPAVTGYLTLTHVSGIALNFKVYNGTDMHNAVQLVAGNDTVSISVQEGVPYYISVSSQSSSSYGAFSFSGTRINQLPLKQITFTGGSARGFGGKDIVVEPNSNKIFCVASGFSNVIMSADGGNTFSEVFNMSYFSTDRYIMAIFLDNDDNLVITGIVFTSNTGYYVYFVVRDKDSGAITSYTQTPPQPPTLPPDSFWGNSFDFCQSEDGAIHAIQTSVRADSFVNNLIYYNFLNGVISTAKYVTGYRDGSAAWAGLSSGDVGIIYHNSQLLVFWQYSTQKTNNGFGGFYFAYNVNQYCVLSDHMDSIAASSAWITSRAYYPNEIVLQASVYYVCLIAHTSGTFATDLGAGKWAILSGNTEPTVYDGPWNELTDFRIMRAPCKIRSANGDLYFYYIFTDDGLFVHEFYKNFVKIPLYPAYIDLYGDQWFGNYSRSQLQYDLADNGDFVLYGGNQTLFQGPASVLFYVGGEWIFYTVTGTFPHYSANYFAESIHTYNFESFS